MALINSVNDKGRMVVEFENPKGGAIHDEFIGTIRELMSAAGATLRIEIPPQSEKPSSRTTETKAPNKFEVSIDFQDVQNFGTVAIVKPKGSLNDEGAQPFQNTMLTVKKRAVLFDLSELKHITGDGLGAFVSAWQRFGKENRILAVSGPLQASVKEQLEITKLNTVFTPQFPDLPTALARIVPIDVTAGEVRPPLRRDSTQDMHM